MARFLANHPNGEQPIVIGARCGRGICSSRNLRRGQWCASATTYCLGVECIVRVKFPLNLSNPLGIATPESWGEKKGMCGEYESKASLNKQ